MFSFVNGKSLIHLYDFEDTFVQQCPDVLESWFCYKNVYDKQEHLRINFIVFLNGIIQMKIFFKSWFGKGVKVERQDF